MDAESWLQLTFWGALDDEEFFVIEGSPRWRGLRESGSQAFCHTIPYKTNSNDFGGFLELLISIFEFEFCRCEIYFLNDLKFLVCSCECAVACLCPRNSISNVVASTIHDDRNIHFNVTIVEGRANRSFFLGLGGERQIEH